MLVKDLPNPRTRTHKIYTKFKNKGIPYPEAKKIIVDKYSVASSGDLTLEQYAEVREYIRSLPSIKIKPTIKINHIEETKKKTIFLKRKRRG